MDNKLKNFLIMLVLFFILIIRLSIAANLNDNDSDIIITFIDNDRHTTTYFNSQDSISFGMNVHPVLMYWDFPVFDDVLTHLKGKHSKILRIDAYYDQGNSRLFKALYCAIKYNFDVLLYFPQCDISVDKNKYLEYIESLAAKLDGTHFYNKEGVESEDGIPLHVRYFEITNEPDLKKGLSVGNWFSLYREGVERIRSIRNDVLFVSPALGYYPTGSKYWSDMCSYIDSDGKRLSDFCDIISAHIYVDDNDELVYKRLNEHLYEGFKQDLSLLNKPLWITETGLSAFEFLDLERAKHSVIQNLYLMSSGISALFYYQYYSYGINNLIGQDTKESSYYVIPHASKTSVAHFYVNDTEKRPLSSGDALQNVTVSPYHNDYIWFQVHSDHPSSRKNFVYHNLKKSGVAIDGDGFHIHSIELFSDKALMNKKQVVWSGDFITGDSMLKIPPSSFSSLNENDYIKVNISNVKTRENDLIDFEESFTERALSVLYSVCSPHVHKLNVNKISTINYASFLNEQFKKVYVLWSKNTLSHQIRYTGHLTSVFDYLGNPLTLNKRVTISDSPIYIIGPDSIILK